MPRNGSGVYTLPSEYEAFSGERATALQHNSPLEDLRTDANLPRPIVAGGTGATSASAAREALGLDAAEITPEQYADNTTPGTTDMSAALQSMCDDCLSTGRRGIANGTYNVASTTITDRTGGLIDWSKAVLVSNYGGQSTPVFSFETEQSTFASNAPLLAAVNAIIAAGEWQAGRTILPSLAAYEGLSFRIASTTNYIIRQTDASDYRNDLQIEVVDGEGKLNRPLPYDILSSVVMTTCEGQTVGKRVTVKMPFVSIQGGSTARTNNLLQVSRANTHYLGGGIIDGGGAIHNASARITGATSVSWDDLSVPRDTDGEHGNAYGVTINYASGVTLTRLSGNNSKRQMNADYTHGVTLIDCHCPDGVFGHFHFGMRVFGGFYSCDDPGLAPFLCAGGDITIIGAEVHRPGNGANEAAIVSTRSDLFEVRGAIRLEDCDITFDVADLGAGTVDLPLVFIDSPNAAHDFGRDVHFPDLISVKGNRVKVLGTTATPRVPLLVLETTKNASDSVVIDTTFEASGNSFVFENGAPLIRVAGVRQTNWTGAGLRARIRDVPNLTVFWGATSGHATNTDARATWDIDVEGSVTMNTDFEATKEYRVNCHSFTFNTAVGATSAVTDEQWWHRIRGGAPSRTLGAIADDAAVSFAAPATYATILLTRIEGGIGGLATQFTADNTSGGGAFIQWSNGATVEGFSAALTGTLQTDGQLNIGANSNGRIYIENRTGASIPGVVVSHIAAGS